MPGSSRAELSRCFRPLIYVSTAASEIHRLGIPRIAEGPRWKGAEKYSRQVSLRRLINAATLRRKGSLEIPFPPGSNLLGPPSRSHSPLSDLSPFSTRPDARNPRAMLLYSNWLNVGVNWKPPRVVPRQPRRSVSKRRRAPRREACRMPASFPFLQHGLLGRSRNLEHRSNFVSLESRRQSCLVPNRRPE